MRYVITENQQEKVIQSMIDNNFNRRKVMLRSERRRTRCRTRSDLARAVVPFVLVRRRFTREGSGHPDRIRRIH